MKITSVGDISFARKIGQKEIEKIVPNTILKKFHESDFSLCNFESPLTKSLQKQTNHYSKIISNEKAVFLKSNPLNALKLKKMGFNIASIANNHILDFGVRGLYDTIKNLNSLNITTLGAGRNILEARKPRIFNNNGEKIAFLAYSYTYEATFFSAGCAPLWPKLILEDIKNIRKKVDNIVISLHFGDEYSNYPRTKSTKLCRKLIRNGATLIIGHHPHVLQCIEEYNEGLISYSLGNFIFDSYQDIKDPFLFEKTRQSIILQVNIEKGQISDYNIIPIYLNENGLPQIPTNEKAQEIIENLNSYLDISKNNSNIPKIDKKYYSDRIMNLFKIFYESVKKSSYKNIYLLIMRGFFE